MRQRNTIWWGIGVLVVPALVLGGVMLYEQQQQDPGPSLYEPVDQETDTFAYVDTYDAYQSYLAKHQDGVIDNDRSLRADDFAGQGYLLYTSPTDLCRERATLDHTSYENGIVQLYFQISYHCGVCALTPITYIIPIEQTAIDDVQVYARTVSMEECDANVVYKPIIYVYPLQDMDLTIRLGRSDRLLHAYPKYTDMWRVHVCPDGTIYDDKTQRSYYGLYWEAVDNTKANETEGFVVKGEDTVSFLEEKLALLGLNERESNEFIIYWIDKLEANPYNLIRFRTIEEINALMPLSFSKQPDTLIRVIMDVTPLSEKRTVEPQQLTPVERNGFTVVEWGGVIHPSQN